MSDTTTWKVVIAGRDQDHNFDSTTKPEEEWLHKDLTITWNDGKSSMFVREPWSVRIEEVTA